MPVRLNGSTSGYVDIAAPAVAGTNTITLPAATGTVLTTAGGQTVSGTTTVTTVNATTIQVGGNQAVNGPAFSAYQSSSQTLSSSTFAKLQFQTEEFDTANCFDNVTNYRFTPNVAGYYQFSGGFQIATSNTNIVVSLYKNGSGFKQFVNSSTGYVASYGSALVYMNGTTDYVELYGLVGTGQGLQASATLTYFQGVMVRGA